MWFISFGRLGKAKGEQMLPAVGFKNDAGLAIRRPNIYL